MIKITFNNPNSKTLSQIEVYRVDIGQTIADDATNPVATLDGYATEFVDYNTLPGVDYNYRFKTFRQGGGFAWSDTMVFGDVYKYGPGAYYSGQYTGVSTWVLESQIESELLPTIDQLYQLVTDVEMDQNSIGWTGDWTKFKVGNNIYFTPHKGFIAIPFSKVSDFLTNVINNPIIKVGAVDYTMAVTELAAADVQRIFDGNYPSLYPFNTAYPRKTLPQVIAQQSVIDVDKVRCIMIPTTAGFARCFTNKAGASGSPAAYGTYGLGSSDTYNWYWKPILRFVPKTTRNYDDI